MKFINLIDSTWIGINLWLIPHTSEHWPKIKPGLFSFRVIWFNWFGTQSIFVFIEGSVHEWITSVDEVIIIICKLKGRIKWLSVSMRLKSKLCLLIKYDSIFLLRFMYS